jgi:DNA polymerase
MLKSDVPGVADARAIADRCNTLAELAEAVSSFSGCSLRTPATRTVFSDGVPDAPVMVIGEAPGAEEDRLGKPFVGPSGRLLDLMLNAIGLDRQRNVYITNVVFWRPPGNRTPTPIETGVCLPFVERQIVLLKPKILILSGSIAARTVLSRTDGITKFRGRWNPGDMSGVLNAVSTIAVFHPSYLLRSSAQKRETWRDILLVKMKLQELGIST